MFHQNLYFDSPAAPLPVLGYSAFPVELLDPRNSMVVLGAFVLWRRQGSTVHKMVAERSSIGGRGGPCTVGAMRKKCVYKKINNFDS